MGGLCLPVGGDEADVVDDLPVGGPCVSDGFNGTDSGASWVSARSEPVVLGGSGGPGPDSGVGDSVAGVGEDLVAELGALGNLKFQKRWGLQLRR